MELLDLSFRKLGMDCAEQEPLYLCCVSLPLPLGGDCMAIELYRAVQYRHQAAELIKASQRITDSTERAVMLDLATTYHRMAEQIEQDSKPKDAS